MGLKVAAIIAALSAALVAATAVRADGEAGLVVDYGDGRVDTFCIAFAGDNVSGESLIAQAGLDVNAMGGLVCGIDGVGCNRGADCLCKCKTGGSDCEYWAFFTQRYGGSWEYSLKGYWEQTASDGDLHAWKWGKGGPMRAPAPPATTFEQVCGHAPGLSSQVPTATPIATVTPPATREPPEPAPAETATATATSSATETINGTTPAVPAAPETKSPATVTPTPPAATLRPSPSPPPSATGSQLPAGEETGGAPASMIAFAGVAGTLVAALGAAIVWRQRRGH